MAVAIEFNAISSPKVALIGEPRGTTKWNSLSASNSLIDSKPRLLCVPTHGAKQLEVHEARPLACLAAKQFLWLNSSQTRNLKTNRYQPVALSGALVALGGWCECAEVGRLDSKANRIFSLSISSATETNVHVEINVTRNKSSCLIWKCK